METKISLLGLTRKKLISYGIIQITLGLILIVSGQSLPHLFIQTILAILILIGIYDLYLRFRGKHTSQDSLLLSLLKLLLLIMLFYMRLIPNLSFLIVSIVVNLYFLLISFIDLVTYAMYHHHKIRPRLFLLLDGLFLLALAISGLLNLNPKSTFHFIGIYVLLYGFTSLKDGITFDNSTQTKKRRRKRRSLPIFIAALIPRRTLEKINAYMENQPSQHLQSIYNVTKHQKVNFEIFIHVMKEGFGAIGHVDLAFEGRIISFGNYDDSSLRLFSTMGDGVLFDVNRDQYIEFCKQKSHKTLLCYGLSLNPTQYQQVKNKISEIYDMTTPWQPSTNPSHYSHQLTSETQAKWYKFTQSKFKTYFVLSTNCVLLADQVIGAIGTDLLDIRGYISPGTYQAYLDREFERPHSLVVSKTIYQDR